MEIKLNIYNKKEIVKTYTTNSYDIQFGTVEDLINLIDLDKLKSDDDFELIKMVGIIVNDGFDIVKQLLKDMFEGLTDEELRCTKVSEIISALSEPIKFVIKRLYKGGNSKNE
mgnify:CR=1 FL=1